MLQTDCWVQFAWLSYSLSSWSPPIFLRRFFFFFFASGHKSQTEGIVWTEKPFPLNPQFGAVSYNTYPSWFYDLSNSTAFALNFLFECQTMLPRPKSQTTTRPIVLNSPGHEPKWRQFYELWKFTETDREKVLWRKFFRQNNQHRKEFYFDLKNIWGLGAL